MNLRSSAKYHNSDDFTAGDKLTEATGGQFLHEVHKVNSKEDNSTYYKKSINSRLSAAVEATAGQMFNLLMPYQPQTLLAKNKENNLFILSQEIPGYQSLADQSKTDEDFYKLKNSINNGTLSGFGSVMTAAYFLNETDAKLGNLGMAKINNELKVIKIDSNWCFSAVQDPKKFGYSSSGQSAHITEKGIQMLPMMRDYKTWNWLDFSENGKINSAYLQKNRNSLIDDSLPNQVNFRKEVNETMLKIALLPQELMKEIASRNTNEEKYHQAISDEIVNRQTQMHQAALKNKSFNTYLQTPEAKQCLTEMISNIDKFQNTNNLPKIDYAEKLTQQFQNLQFQNQIAIYDNKIASVLDLPGDKLEDTQLKFNSLKKIKAEIQAEIKKNPDETSHKLLEDQVQKVTAVIDEVKANHMINYNDALLNQAINKFWDNAAPTLEVGIQMTQNIVNKAQELFGLVKDDSEKAKYQAIVDTWTETTKDLTERLNEDNQNVSHHGMSNR